MVTVIDMTTGEVLHSSQPQKCEGNAPYEHEQRAYALPALQEIALEPERDSHRMPPELAQVSLSAFLTKFD